MRFLLAAGGTAGHINPALALAEELKERGHEVEFVGNPEGLESTLVAAAGYPFIPLESAGFNRSQPLSLFKALRLVSKGVKHLKKRFKSSRPDAVVGFGAYVEVSAVRAAYVCKIPVVIHEQNSVVGIANKMVAPYAHAIALTYPATRETFAQKAPKNCDIRCIGNPVRRSVLDADGKAGRDQFNVAHNGKLLVVFGGSLGAQHINKAIIQCKEELFSRPDLYVVHATGKAAYDEAVAQLSLTPEEQKRWIVAPYIHEMGNLLKAADCVLSRAGATSVAEITALNVPALLVPYPHARSDHQTKNAQHLVDSGAAYMIADDKLETDEFKNLLFELIDNDEKREELSQAARKLKSACAAHTLADMCEKVARAATQS